MSNNAGFAARFGNNESFFLTFGFPVSGLLSNFIAWFCLYMGDFFTPNFQFLMYLFFSNLGLAVHYYYLTIFFKECKANKYTIEIPNLSKNKNEIEPLELKLINKDSEILTKKDQDYNKKSDENTLTIFENIKAAYILYLMIFLNFFLFMFAFPILTFQINISRVVQIKYKYIVHSLLINIAAFLGNRLYLYLLIKSRAVGNCLAIGKVVFVVIIYYSREKQILGNMLNDWAKVALLLLFYFYNNNTLMMMINLGQRFYDGRPYDRLKFGEINQYFIQVAGFLGTLSASLVK